MVLINRRGFVYVDLLNFRPRDAVIPGDVTIICNNLGSSFHGEVAIACVLTRALHVLLLS